MKTYFILMESPEPMVKIGKSNNPKSRLKSISTSTPFEVSIIAILETLETDLHKQFANKRINKEWFKFDNEIQEFIKDYRCEIKTRKPELIKEKIIKPIIEKKIKAKIIKIKINPWHFAISYIDFYLLKRFSKVELNKTNQQLRFYDERLACWIPYESQNVLGFLDTFAHRLLKEQSNIKNVSSLVNFAKVRIPIEIRGRIEGRYGTGDKYHIPEMEKIAIEMSGI